VGFEPTTSAWKFSKAYPNSNYRQRTVKRSESKIRE
jgi:hypothetical protein